MAFLLSVRKNPNMLRMFWEYDIYIWVAEVFPLEGVSDTTCFRQKYVCSGKNELPLGGYLALALFQAGSQAPPPWVQGPMAHGPQWVQGDPWGVH